MPRKGFLVSHDFTRAKNLAADSCGDYGRFTFRLRKYDHVSNIRKSQYILSMQIRRLLHSVCMMFRIRNKFAPNYLCERITCHDEIHNHNTRNRNNIRAPFARSNMRAMSFFVYISNKFNELSNHFKTTGISLNTFKTNCKKYFLELEAQWDSICLLIAINRFVFFPFFFSPCVKQCDITSKRWLVSSWTEYIYIYLLWYA